MGQNKKSVLIVEDDVDFRTPLRDFLSMRGYEVSVADDGEQGIDRLLVHRPSVVILDLLLPKLYGIDVLKKIREYPDEQIKNTAVIILTNVSRQSDVEQSNELGVSAYFVKAHTSQQEIYSKIQETIFGSAILGGNEVMDFSQMQ